nr:MAG TPA: hypothetical protein [Caudoviricetes sp.]
MAVANVWGECNGYNIIFSYNNGTGTWDVSVPFAESGEYIMTVYAEDLAGNIGYYATLLLVVDKESLRVEIKILDMSAKAKKDGFLTNSSASSMQTRVYTTIVNE